MAPRTVGELARETAHGGHIRHENYEYTGVKGPAPASAYGHDPNLRHGDLGYVAYHGHALGTAPSGNIPEFTYIGGPVPSPTTRHGQILHPGGRKPMAHDELTKGMASIGHILLGNHEVFHTNGSTPIVSFYPVQANRVGSLDPAVKLCPEQRFHHHA